MIEHEVMKMRYAFLSDIHGNAVALEAVLEDIQSHKIDKIAVLGDIAFRGPEPKKSIELIQALKTDVIKGNADQWVVSGVKEGEVPQQALDLMQQEQAWTYKQLTDEHISYLKNLPTELTFDNKGIQLHAFHATPDSLFDVVLPTISDTDLLEKLTKNVSADIYLYGHIHKAYQRIVEGKTIVNLGSVGLPFDGIAKASYVIVDISDGKIETQFVRVPYDVEKVCQQYEDVNYPNAKMMQNIVRTGRN